MMKRTLYTILISLSALATTAQTNNSSLANDGVIAGFFDTDDIYSGFRLPPLGQLFENAMTNPTVEILAREEAIQRELVKKEKKSYLEFFTGHANYTYGIMDNYGSNSTVTSPIYYQYMGSQQSYWNLGASVSVPLDVAFDYHGRVRRQKLNADKARLEKEMAYEELKQKIASLYVRIENNLIALKISSEHAAAYKGAGELTNEEFKMGDVSVRDLAETKRWEYDAIVRYQELQSTITTDILVLEILTHTPIITNVIVDMKLEEEKK